MRAAPRPSDKLTPLNAMAAPAKGCPDVSFMCPADPHPSPSINARSYGGARGWRHIVHAAIGGLAVAAVTIVGAPAAPPIKIVALGDSLTAGLGLPASEGF